MRTTSLLLVLFLSANLLLSNTAGQPPPVTAPLATVRAAPTELLYYLPVQANNYPYYTEQVLIPDGEFQMGCGPSFSKWWYSCSSFALPLHTVYLDTYRIDKHEVTNGQYAQCVEQGACLAPYWNYSYNRPWYYGNPEFANYPVLFVDWEMAAAYCAWRNMRLPTEAEWEKAARGAGQASIYPWGNDIPECLRANTWNDLTGQWCLGDTAAVGSYPYGASPYGVLDMAGNVMEWVNDWWQEDYYRVSPYANPPGPATGTWKVLRGGHWYSGWGDFQVSYRFTEFVPYDPTAVGFRCADAP